MPLTGDMSINQDKTENYSITGIKENNTNNVSVTGFVSGLRKEVNPMNPNTPPYDKAGVSVGIENYAGSMGLTSMHLPNRADVITASTNVNLINNDNHKLNTNAFTTKVMPKAGPNFGTHGGGVDYCYKNTLGANASVSHTPMFKQTSYSVGGTMNLHQTPTTSLGLNVGASRTDTPFSRGNWQPDATLNFQKRF